MINSGSFINSQLRTTEKHMRIGILGAGMIGGTLGTLWHNAGHEVCFANRHPEKLHDLVSRLGPRATVDTVEAAASFGPVVLWAVPLVATPELGQRLSALLKDKVVLDTANPYPARDGAIAQEVIASGRGTGVWTAGHLPTAKVVRAFNTVFFKTLQNEANRLGDRLGIPLAGDDDDALQVAAQLAIDAGFAPVIVGELDRGRSFEPGTLVYNTGMSASALRRALGV